MKFSLPLWHPEIKEGWYDANVWPNFIDYLVRKSSSLSLVRKEVGIINDKSTDRFDGVFRYIFGGIRVDLGAVEVASVSDRPNSDRKPTKDRAKLIRGMHHMLKCLREGYQDDNFQSISFLCCGMYSFYLP